MACSLHDARESLFTVVATRVSPQSLRAPVTALASCTVRRSSRETNGDAPECSSVGGSSSDSFSNATFVFSSQGRTVLWSVAGEDATAPSAVGLGAVRFDIVTKKSANASAVRCPCRAEAPSFYSHATITAMAAASSGNTSLLLVALGPFVVAVPTSLFSVSAVPSLSAVSPCRECGGAGHSLMPFPIAAVHTEAFFVRRSFQEPRIQRLVPLLLPAKGAPSDMHGHHRPQQDVQLSIAALSTCGQVAVLRAEVLLEMERCDVSATAIGAAPSSLCGAATRFSRSAVRLEGCRIAPISPGAEKGDSLPAVGTSLAAAAVALWPDPLSARSRSDDNNNSINTTFDGLGTRECGDGLAALCFFGSYTGAVTVQLVRHCPPYRLADPTADGGDASADDGELVGTVTISSHSVIPAHAAACSVLGLAAIARPLLPEHGNSTDAVEVLLASGADDRTACVWRLVTSPFLAVGDKDAADGIGAPLLTRGWALIWRYQPHVPAAPLFTTATCASTTHLTATSSHSFWQQQPPQGLTGRVRCVAFVTVPDETPRSHSSVEGSSAGEVCSDAANYFEALPPLRAVGLSIGTDCGTVAVWPLPSDATSSSSAAEGPTVPVVGSIVRSLSAQGVFKGQGCGSLLWLGGNGLGAHTRGGGRDGLLVAAGWCGGLWSARVSIPFAGTSDGCAPLPLSKLVPLAMPLSASPLAGCGTRTTDPTRGAPTSSPPHDASSLLRCGIGHAQVRCVSTVLPELWLGPAEDCPPPLAIAVGADFSLFASEADDMSASPVSPSSPLLPPPPPSFSLSLLVAAFPSGEQRRQGSSGGGGGGGVPAGIPCVLWAAWRPVPSRDSDSFVAAGAERWALLDVVVGTDKGEAVVASIRIGWRLRCGGRPFAFVLCSLASSDYHGGVFGAAAVAVSALANGAAEVRSFAPSVAGRFVSLVPVGRFEAAEGAASTDLAERLFIACDGVRKSLFLLRLRLEGCGGGLFAAEAQESTASERSMPKKGSHLDAFPLPLGVVGNGGSDGDGLCASPALLSACVASHWLNAVPAAPHHHPSLCQSLLVAVDTERGEVAVVSVTLPPTTTATAEAPTFSVLVPLPPNHVQGQGQESGTGAVRQPIGAIPYSFLPDARRPAVQGLLWRRGGGDAFGATLLLDAFASDGHYWTLALSLSFDPSEEEVLLAYPCGGGSMAHSDVRVKTAVWSAAQKLPVPISRVLAVGEAGASPNFSSRLAEGNTCTLVAMLSSRAVAFFSRSLGAGGWALSAQLGFGTAGAGVAPRHLSATVASSSAGGAALAVLSYAAPTSASATPQLFGPRGQCFAADVGCRHLLSPLSAASSTPITGYDMGCCCVLPRPPAGAVTGLAEDTVTNIVAFGGEDAAISLLSCARGGDNTAKSVANSNGGHFFGSHRANVLGMASFRLRGAAYFVSVGSFASIAIWRALRLSTRQDAASEKDLGDSCMLTQVWGEPCAASNSRQSAKNAKRARAEGATSAAADAAVPRYLAVSASPFPLPIGADHGPRPPFWGDAAAVKDGVAESAFAVVGASDGIVRCWSIAPRGDGAAYGPGVDAAVVLPLPQTVVGEESDGEGSDAGIPCGVPSAGHGEGHELPHRLSGRVQSPIFAVDSVACKDTHDKCAALGSAGDGAVVGFAVAGDKAGQLRCFVSLSDPHAPPQATSLTGKNGGLRLEEAAAVRCGEAAAEKGTLSTHRAAPFALRFEDSINAVLITTVFSDKLQCQRHSATLAAASSLLGAALVLVGFDGGRVGLLRICFFSDRAATSAVAFTFSAEVLASASFGFTSIRRLRLLPTSQPEISEGTSAVPSESASLFSFVVLQDGLVTRASVVARRAVASDDTLALAQFLGAGCIASPPHQCCAAQASFACECFLFGGAALTICRDKSAATQVRLVTDCGVMGLPVITGATTLVLCGQGYEAITL